MSDLSNDGIFAFHGAVEGGMLWNGCRGRFNRRLNIHEHVAAVQAQSLNRWVGANHKPARSPKVTAARTPIAKRSMARSANNVVDTAATRCQGEPTSASRAPKAM